MNLSRNIRISVALLILPLLLPPPVLAMRVQAGLESDARVGLEERLRSANFQSRSFLSSLTPTIHAGLEETWVQRVKRRVAIYEAHVYETTVGVVSIQDALNKTGASVPSLEGVRRALDTGDSKKVRVALVKAKRKLARLEIPTFPKDHLIRDLQAALDVLTASGMDEASAIPPADGLTPLKQEDVRILVVTDSNKVRGELSHLIHMKRRELIRVQIKPDQVGVFSNIRSARKWLRNGPLPTIFFWVPWIGPSSDRGLKRLIKEIGETSPTTPIIQLSPYEYDRLGNSVTLRNAIQAHILDRLVAGLEEAEWEARLRAIFQEATAALGRSDWAGMRAALEPVGQLQIPLEKLSEKVRHNFYMLGVMQVIALVQGVYDQRLETGTLTGTAEDDLHLALTTAQPLHVTDPPLPPDVQRVLRAEEAMAATMLAFEDGLGEAFVRPIILHPDVPEGYRWRLLTWLEAKYARDALSDIERAGYGGKDWSNAPSGMSETFLRHTRNAFATWLLMLASPSNSFLNQIGHSRERAIQDLTPIIFYLVHSRENVQQFQAERVVRVVENAAARVGTIPGNLLAGARNQSEPELFNLALISVHLMEGVSDQLQLSDAQHWFRAFTVAFHAGLSRGFPLYSIWWPPQFAGMEEKPAAISAKPALKTLLIASANPAVRTLLREAASAWKGDLRIIETDNLQKTKEALADKENLPNALLLDLKVLAGNSNISVLINNVAPSVPTFVFGQLPVRGVDESGTTVFTDHPWVRYWRHPSDFAGVGLVLREVDKAVRHAGMEETFAPEDVRIAIIEGSSLKGARLVQLVREAIKQSSNPLAARIPQYEIRWFWYGEEATRWIREQGKNLRLIIVGDLFKGHIRGPEIVKTVQQANPNAVVIWGSPSSPAVAFRVTEDIGKEWDAARNDWNHDSISRVVDEYILKHLSDAGMEEAGVANPQSRIPGLPPELAEAIRNAGQEAPIVGPVRVDQSGLPQLNWFQRLDDRLPSTDQLPATVTVLTQRGLLPEEVLAHFHQRLRWRVDLLPEDVGGEGLVAQASEWSSPLLVVVDAGLEEAVRQLPGYKNITAVVVNRNDVQARSVNWWLSYLLQTLRDLPGRFVKVELATQAGMEENAVFSWQL